MAAAVDGTPLPHGAPRTALSTPPEPLHTDAIVIGAGPVGLFQVFQLGLQGLCLWHPTCFAPHHRDFFLHFCPGMARRHQGDAYTGSANLLQDNSRACLTASHNGIGLE